MISIIDGSTHAGGISVPPVYLIGVVTVTGYALKLTPKHVALKHIDAFIEQGCIKFSQYDFFRQGSGHSAVQEDAKEGLIDSCADNRIRKELGRSPLAIVGGNRTVFDSSGLMLCSFCTRPMPAIPKQSTRHRFLDERPVVRVVDCASFFGRLKSACEAEWGADYFSCGRCVYYDELDRFEDLELEQTCGIGTAVKKDFMKSGRFATQSEYRVACHSPRLLQDSRSVVTLGDISSICEIVPEEEREYLAERPHSVVYLRRIRIRSGHIAEIGSMYV